MSRSFGMFFGAMIGFVLFCTLLGFSGIDRLKQLHQPPFSDPGYLALMTQIVSTPEKLLLFADSAFGCVVLWLAALGIPATCLWLWHKAGRPIVAGTILFGTAIVFGWYGIRIWIHAYLDAVEL